MKLSGAYLRGAGGGRVVKPLRWLVKSPNEMFVLKLYCWNIVEHLIIRTF